MSRVSQARSLGKYFLLVDNMLVVLGFFVVFPLISIRFVDQMGWAALMVGIALGLRQLVQQGLGIFGGAIADRFGAKPMIVTGMLMRAGGFAAMAVAHEPWVLWFSCILSGLGGTLFDPPRAALVVKLVRPHQRGRFFSILMMQDSAGAVIGALLGSWLLQYDFRLVCSAGAVIGALLGSWLLQYDFRLVCSAGAALFIACAAFNAWYLPAWKLSTVKTPIREGLGRVLRDKRFVTYVLTLTGYYMLAVQVMLMLPIMVNDIAGSPAAVKWMYAIEATISLTLLYPIARWSEKRFRLEHRLMAGLLVMTLAMLPIGMTSSLQQLFTLICLFYIGSIIAEPARETLGASLADARARGSYMGFSRLGLAFGGALGYAGGGWLFDAGKAVGQPELPWLMLGAIGVITFLALWWQFSPKRSASGMLEPRT
ncbi:multidrug efflux MFS transporter MdtH [Klebsiella pneumoniae]|uniref:multidrug efflux MFS transporter MdtH n=1 Tax=Klebsiella pneumoniae TaxID=573 RepID=UPI001FF5EB93|nr:multidrug efflux MFS transporter MdtH [Klebsiella pneumoniae]HBT3828858.1 multidrug efflux MFS transporter MdtH [Klebsiella pneumoniae]